MNGAATSWTQPVPGCRKVWTTVEKHKKHTFTSIIHGKVKHEETLATSSFAGTYLVVLDLAEAQLVADYILGKGDREVFMARFATACSPGFDPDRDLDRLGVANQTTMLKSETEEIGRLFERTMLSKYGPTQLNDHFLAFNTICDATQERQDAMFSLVDESLDLMVVIGGFNSSNTTHLQEIAVSRGIRSFHIDTPERLDTASNSIEHKPLSKALRREESFSASGACHRGDHIRGLNAGPGCGGSDRETDAAERKLRHNSFTLVHLPMTFSVLLCAALVGH